MDTHSDMINRERRSLLKAASAGMAIAALPTGALNAASALPPASASPTGALIVRNIPKTNDTVPAIGLGTFMTFDTLPGTDQRSFTEVMRRFWGSGGRVIDTSPLYGMAEVNVGHITSMLGINQQMFTSNKIWATGDYLADDSQALHSLELSRQRLWRDQIDLMQCHSLVNVDVIVPLLKAWKKEGRIRFLGVTHYETPYFEPLAQWVEKGDLDFVQVHYSIHTRQAEDRILPAAIERGVAVNVNMPLEKARLHKLVEGRALPDFVRELGIENWSAFFLKWVISHPAVTCALPATTNPNHLDENMTALTGPLPDKEMRQRMVKHMETIPGFDRLAEMPWYPGKSFNGVIANAQKILRRQG